MRIVLQRVKKASVEVNNKVIGEIQKGFVLLIGITDLDNDEDIHYLIKKIPNLRIFEDDQGKLNLSLLDVKGEILAISQFTLFGNIKKGNRPSFDKSAKFDQALMLYNAFITELKKLPIPIQTGEFGQMMNVSLINEGPVTLIIDSKEKDY